MKIFVILSMAASLLILAITPVVGTQDEALKIFEDNDCSDCHNISAVGIGELPTADADDEDDGWGDDWGDDDEAGPPDLSNTGMMADAEWLGQWLNKKVDVAGNKHPERFGGSAEELEMLTTWLATLKYEMPEGVGVAAHPVPDKDKKEKKEGK